MAGQAGGICALRQVQTWRNESVTFTQSRFQSPRTVSRCCHGQSGAMLKASRFKDKEAALSLQSILESSGSEEGKSKIERKLLFDLASICYEDAENYDEILSEGHEAYLRLQGEKNRWGKGREREREGGREHEHCSKEATLSQCMLALTIKIERSKENQIRDPFYLSSTERFPHEGLNTAIQGKNKVIR